MGIKLWEVNVMFLCVCGSVILLRLFAHALWVYVSVPLCVSMFTRICVCAPQFILLSYVTHLPQHHVVLSKRVT